MVMREFRHCQRLLFYIPISYMAYNMRPEGDENRMSIADDRHSQEREYESGKSRTFTESRISISGVLLQLPNDKSLAYPSRFMVRDATGSAIMCIRMFSLHTSCQNRSPKRETYHAGATCKAIKLISAMKTTFVYAYSYSTLEGGAPVESSERWRRSSIAIVGELRL